MTELESFAEELKVQFSKVADKDPGAIRPGLKWVLSMMPRWKRRAPRFRTRAEVIFAFSEDASLGEAASALGCSVLSVARLRKKFGLPAAKRGARSHRKAAAWKSKRTREEVKAVMDSTRTLEEAGRLLGGVSRERARQLAAEHGVRRVRAHAKAEPFPKIGEWEDWLDVLSVGDVIGLLDLRGMARSLVSARVAATRQSIRTRSVRRAVLALKRDSWPQGENSEAVGTSQTNVSRILRAARR